LVVADTQTQELWDISTDRKPLILCVDDTPSLLEGQKLLLEENGYRVLIASNGLDAVKAFVSNSVDLVLLDYHMPGMNGCLAAACLKDSKPGVPIALISGDEDVPPTDLKSIDCSCRNPRPSAAPAQSQSACSFRTANAACGSASVGSSSIAR
jgi:CheY-like chemotaxis protein